jgi:hypothetical protein
MSKRVTYKQLHSEVVRVFGEHTDEPIAWVTGPHGKHDCHLIISPGGDEQSFEMRFTLYPQKPEHRLSLTASSRRTSARCSF